MANAFDAGKNFGRWKTLCCWEGLWHSEELFTWEKKWGAGAVNIIVILFGASERTCCLLLDESRSGHVVRRRIVEWQTLWLVGKEGMLVFENSAVFSGLTQEFVRLAVVRWWDVLERGIDVRLLFDRQRKSEVMVVLGKAGTNSCEILKLRSEALFEWR